MARGARDRSPGRVRCARSTRRCCAAAARARARALGRAHERCYTLVQHVARELVGLELEAAVVSEVRGSRARYVRQQYRLQTGALPMDYERPSASRARILLHFVTVCVTRGMHRTA